MHSNYSRLSKIRHEYIFGFLFVGIICVTFTPYASAQIENGIKLERKIPGEMREVSYGDIHDDARSIIPPDLTVFTVRLPRLIALVVLVIYWITAAVAIIRKQKTWAWFAFSRSATDAIRIVSSVVIFASLAYESAVLGIQPPLFFIICVPLFWIGVGIAGFLGGCTGGKKKPPPRCCCCVNSVLIQNIQNLIVQDAAGNIVGVGHSFDCVINMQYAGGSGGKCSCVLHWNERTDVPPTGVPNYPANQWVDVFQIFPQSPIFNPWKNRIEPCPQGGPLVVTITDTPLIAAPGMTITAYLDFNIVVDSCGGCGCANVSRSDTARQELEIINGVPTIPGTFRHP